MHCNFVTFPVGLLHRRIVGVLVRNEESGFDVASIRVFAFTVEYLFVQLDVVVVDGVVKSDRDHLWHFFGRQIVGYPGTVFGTKTVGQHAHSWIAWRCAIRIVVVVYVKINNTPGKRLMCKSVSFFCTESSY